MKFKYFFVIGLFILSLGGCKTVIQTEWKTDASVIDEDLVTSKKNGLIIFTISDSDENSKYLLKNVFTEQFFLSAGEKFVLYNVNIVRDETLMPVNILKQNYVLLSKYNVFEVPHLCLTNSDGDIYHSALIPKNIKTTDSFLKYLNKIYEKGLIVDKLKKNIDKSIGVEKIKNIDEFFNKIYLVDSKKYRKLFEEGIKSDPSNTCGLTGKFILAKKQILVEKLLTEKKYDLAINEFIEVINTKMLKPEEEQGLWCNIAYFSTGSNKTSKEQVIKYLENALQVAPNSHRAKDIKADIEYLKKKN